MVTILLEDRMRPINRIKRKRYQIIFFLLTALLLITFGTVQAAPPYPDGVFGPDEALFDELFIEGVNIHIAGTVHGMVFAFGETITIAETAMIDDDAFLFGNQIVVEKGAEIKGNLIIGGQNVKVASALERSLFVGAATLDIVDSAEVNNNLFFGGFHLETGADTMVARNLYSGTYQTILNGSVNQNVRIGAGAVRLNGEIGGDAILNVGAAGQTDIGMQYWYTYMQQSGIPEPIEAGLLVGEAAKIDGQLVYTSPSAVYGLEESNIAGGFLYQTPQPENMVEVDQQQIKITYRNPLLLRAGGVLRNLVTLLILGGFILWLVPGRLKEMSANAAEKPINSAGIGLVSMIVVYIGGGMLVGLLIFISILFGMFSLGGLSRAVFFFGFTSLVWIISTYTIVLVFISILVAANWLGTLVLSTYLAESKYKAAVDLFIGILIVVLVSAIPFVGGIISLMMMLIGLGAMWFYFKKEKITVVEAA
jgi:cytoskeletal protein CcmA (bactofilin family)